MSAYGDYRRTACIIRTTRRFFFAGDSHRLFDQRFDDLVFRHGLDDFALDENLALAVTRRDAQVGFARFTRAVADATHHRNAQRDVHALEPRGHLVGQRVDVDLRASARRARHDLQAAGTQIERL